LEDTDQSFGLIKASDWVLDPDYRWAVEGHRSRLHGWVLARSNTLPERRCQQFFRCLRERGYDPARFVNVPELP
jgi:apolipoprotein D and lipocalin family protein